MRNDEPFLSRKLLFFVGLIFFVGCQPKSAEKTLAKETDNWAKCPVGKPTAIFSDTMATVQHHEFALDATKGIEKILFKDASELEVAQTGCEKVRQAFSFLFKGNFKDKDSNFWAKKAATSFKNLSKTSPKLLGLSEFGKVIEAAAPQLHLGAPFKTEFGITITIDCVAAADSTILIVILQQD
jgi:hypothetical protein